MSVDWGHVRGEFPALENWTFLNTATFGQLPRRASEAVARHLRQRDRLACWNFLEWFDDADRIRGEVARLVGARAEDIAFVTNASTALAVLTGGLDWRPGDRIVTLTDEFPNNIYVPAVLAQRGVEHVETPWESFYDAIIPGTRLVILSTVNYVTGLRPPLEEVSKFLRERDVLLYVDGTQSVGALTINVGEVQPALLGVDAYKWLLGPTGSGFLYVRPDVRELLSPSVIGWRSHQGWREVTDLHHGAPEFVDAAEKYEGGMLNFPSYGMGASVELMLEIGPDRIEQRVEELAEGARQALRDAGASLLADERPHHRSPIIAARFEGCDPLRLAAGLKERGVLVSARHGCLRVSTHFYNEEADIERLRDELASLL